MIRMAALPGVWTVVGDRAYAHDSTECQMVTLNDDGSVDMAEGVQWFWRTAGQIMIIRSEDFSDD